MYKLTDRRLDAAEEILERNRTWLYTRGSFDVGVMENELRTCWDIGYQSLKGIILDMFKNHRRYKYVAAYYMQHSNPIGVASEFKMSLASLYQLRRVNLSESVGFGRFSDEFWATFASEETYKLCQQLDELRDAFEQLDLSSSPERRNRMAGSIERIERRLEKLTGIDDYW